MDPAPTPPPNTSPPLDLGPSGEPEVLSEWDAEIRESYKEVIRRGEIDELRLSASSCWTATNGRFSMHPFPPEEFEPKLRNLWCLYYNCARNISYSSAEQDRLVLDVLRVQALPTLTRVKKRDDSIVGTDENAFVVAKTSAGVIWKDMPFFVTDMTKYWVTDLSTMTASERLNLAYFLAKLASIGFDNDRLCRIALLVFRETFETVRPLGRLGDHDDANPSRTMADLSIAALLPVANAWLADNTCQDKIVQLSDMLWNDCPVTIGQCSAIPSSHPESEPSAGFSPWRWMHWLRRAEEIVHEATQAGGASLAAYATEVLESLLYALEWRDSRVKREVEAAGGVVKHEIGPIFEGPQE